MRHPSPVTAHHTIRNKPISTYTPHVHPLLLELIPLHLYFFLVWGMMILKKTLCLFLILISMIFLLSCRSLRQYFHKTAGPNCTGNMLVLAEEESGCACMPWRALAASNHSFPSLQNCVCPQDMPNNRAQYRCFQRNLPRSCGEAKRKTQNEFSVEDEQAYLLNVYLTSRIDKMSKLEAREDLRLTSIDKK